VEVRGLKYPNFDTWTGNRGVPTDRQTNQQTDTPTHFIEDNPKPVTSSNPYEDEPIRHYKTSSFSSQEASSSIFPDSQHKKNLNQHIKEA
jgi:hypothetical protein